MKNRKIVLPILFMLLIFFLSIIPMGEIKLRIKSTFGALLTVRSGIQKLLNIELAFSSVQNFLHLPFFALLAFLWMYFFGKRNMPFKRALFYTLAITLIFSVVEESCQFFIIGRDASLLDLFLNFIGSLSGIGTYILCMQNSTCILRR